MAQKKKVSLAREAHGAYTVDVRVFRRMRNPLRDGAK